MVGGINPNASSAAALGLDVRGRSTLTIEPRQEPGAALKDAATASLNDTQAGWRAARDSVQDGLSALDLAMAAGREAVAKLTLIADAAHSGAPLQDLIDSYAQGLNSADAQLLSGLSISVTAEPGAPTISIEGVDARLGFGVAIPADAGGADPAAIARVAQDGINMLQAGLTRFDAAARSLDAHAGFLGAVESVTGARTDISADGARLLALQVRQALEGLSGGIASAQPQAVLSLFKV